MSPSRLLLFGALLTGCGLPFTRPSDDGLVLQLVARADEQARAGSYQEALGTYQRALDQSPPNNPAADRALFGLARLHVTPENPDRDYRQAHQHLERLLKDHPQSRLAGEARAWRDLLATLLGREGEAQRLGQELEQERRRHRDELTEGRRETQRLRQEGQRLRQDAQRARQELERIRQDLDRLRQLELEQERRR
ncbi:MAG: hypothetical protein ACRELA_22665 [Candidatus Rokuibacteriota bacterium]